MANINSVEMGSVLLSDARLTVKKSLFSTKTIYNPSQSNVKFTKKEYAMETGQKIEQILKGSTAEIAKKAAAADRFQDTGLGNYLLEMGASDDSQLAVLRLYHFDQLRYKPITDVLWFEGDEAKSILNLF